MLKKLFNKLFNRKHEYFVSYFSCDGMGSFGFGNATVRGTIKSMSDIQDFEAKLTNANGRKCSIVNYIRL
jgi:hypothetical protein